MERAQVAIDIHVFKCLKKKKGQAIDWTMDFLNIFFYKFIEIESSQSLENQLLTSHHFRFYSYQTLEINLFNGFL